jgi:putative membrane protein
MINMQEFRKDKKLFFSVILLLTVHIAGLIGLHSTYTELFRLATPFNLLLCFTLLFINQPEFNRALLVFSVIVFLGGYFIEVAGVHSGMIFGQYSYQGSLGRQVFGVPVLMGINWLTLICCAGAISHKLKTGIVLKSATGALLLVVMDLLLEQCAPRYGFWSFRSDGAPLRNYFAWFLVSFLFLLLFHASAFRKDNRLAPLLYIIQLLFFALL